MAAIVQLASRRAPQDAHDVSRMRLLSSVEVAEITGLSVETLAQWRSQRREIPYVKLSRNRVGYRVNDLDAWLASRIVTPHSASGRE